MRQRIADELDRCWPWIQAALDHYGPTHTKEHILAALHGADAQLWPLPNSACITRINVFPTGFKELVLWLAGGKLEELQDIEPVLARFGRDTGCNRISIYGRPGWARRLAGYRALGTQITKDIP